MELQTQSLNKKMNVYCEIVRFRVEIDFPESDVDVVYSEMAARGVQSIIPSCLTNGYKPKFDEEKIPKTPTEASVEYALQWLSGYVNRNTKEVQSSKWDKDYSKTIHVKDENGVAYVTPQEVKTELELLGVEVVETYGLMMGCCHLVCECKMELFSADLVQRCTKEVQKVFKKKVKYYKN